MTKKKELEDRRDIFDKALDRVGPYIPAAALGVGVAALGHRIGRGVRRGIDKKFAKTHPYHPWADGGNALFVTGTAAATAREVDRHERKKSKYDK